MVRYDIKAYHWSSYVSRISGKMQKADKGCKGQTKGQRAQKVKILVFLVVLGLFDVNNALI